MLTLEEILNEENQKEAFENFSSKKDTSGYDGIKLSEFPDYWNLNRERIEKEILLGLYQPGIIKLFENINRNGKKRTIAILNSTDRFITRLVTQKLREYIEPLFSLNNYAYQKNKGVLLAVEKIKEYVNNGYIYVAEIDISNFFDEINIEYLLKILDKYICDIRIISLIKKYLYCKVVEDGIYKVKDSGIIQGNPMSPFLANLYLHSLDEYMDRLNYNWIRFSDNIYIFGSSQHELGGVFNDICQHINKKSLLRINQKKSGIYNVNEKIILGYEFYWNNGRIDIKKYTYAKRKVYNNWNVSAIEKSGKDYKIVQDGVLSKKDYELLFENNEGKYHIPLGVTEQLNLYGNVTITSSVLNAISKDGIRIGIFDKFGKSMGYFIPEKSKYSSVTLLNQCKKYYDEKNRLEMARKFELSGMYNMRCNQKYYMKKIEGLKENVDIMGQYIKQTSEAISLNELLLLEARAKQNYYMSFNKIIYNKDFYFDKRTKRPPKDELNCMISFGNTLLYNEILKMIWKTSLNPRVGVVHATNKRNYSLNLDFADLFKPIIIDRIIFSLINKHQIKSKTHFEITKEGGVYLNKEGKYIFLNAFEYKMQSKIVRNNKEYTYRRIIEMEIREYQRFVDFDEKYKPYKHYY